MTYTHTLSRSSHIIPFSLIYWTFPHMNSCEYTTLQLTRPLDLGLSLVHTKKTWVGTLPKHTNALSDINPSILYVCLCPSWTTKRANTTKTHGTHTYTCRQSRQYRKVQLCVCKFMRVWLSVTKRMRERLSKKVLTMVISITENVFFDMSILIRMGSMFHPSSKGEVVPRIVGDKAFRNNHSSWWTIKFKHWIAIMAFILWKWSRPFSSKTGWW